MYTTINISSDESLDTKPTTSLNNKKSRKLARPKNEIAEVNGIMLQDNVVY
jgi:hypothetical protein